MRQSKPADIKVGRSTVNTPALTLLVAWAGLTSSAAPHRPNAHEENCFFVLIIFLISLENSKKRSGPIDDSRRGPGGKNVAHAAAPPKMSAGVTKKAPANAEAFQINPPPQTALAWWRRRGEDIFDVCDEKSFRGG